LRLKTKTPQQISNKAGKLSSTASSSLWKAIKGSIRFSTHAEKQKDSDWNQIFITTSGSKSIKVSSEIFL
jgi:hypothetical protein